MDSVGAYEAKTRVLRLLERVARGERVVVDNSVVVAWCFEGEDDAYALRVLDSLAEGEEMITNLANWL